jgi:hypothetical protein
MIIRENNKTALIQNRSSLGELRKIIDTILTKSPRITSHSGLSRQRRSGSNGQRFVPCNGEIRDCIAALGGLSPHLLV